MTNNLKAILYYEHLSLKELSNSLNISYDALLRITSDISTPNVYRALKIANYLGYTIEEIWGNECPEEIIEMYKDYKLSLLPAGRR